MGVVLVTFAIAIAIAVALVASDGKERWFQSPALILAVQVLLVVIVLRERFVLFQKIVKRIKDPLMRFRLKEVNFYDFFFLCFLNLNIFV